MPAKRVSMRRVRQILRLKLECGASDRAIAVAVSVARSTVQLCLLRAAAAGLSWPLPATLTEQGLEALLFAPLGGSKPGIRHKAEPDWAAIHHELRRPGLAKTYPAAFGKAVPLAAGTTSLLIKRQAQGLSGRERMVAFMDWWQTTDDYLSAVLLESSRFIDLDGADKGPVEEKHRIHAESVLRGRFRAQVLDTRRHEAATERRILARRVLRADIEREMSKKRA